MLKCDLKFNDWKVIGKKCRKGLILVYHQLLGNDTSFDTRGLYFTIIIFKFKQATTEMCCGCAT